SSYALSATEPEMQRTTLSSALVANNLVIASFDSPWHHVATLTIPAQDLFDQRGRATRDRVDALAFDPWRAPADLPARQPQPRPPYGLHGQRERVDAR
ncbi:hypothetical protein AB0D38_13315, partial [Streptomyces sp. NPDC048279]|uniref:hypothetical protein n=1 Tax=Streptomyces sp. NPDC048279 TaxID=3154714 RepID=UPI0034400F53